MPLEVEGAVVEFGGGLFGGRRKQALRGVTVRLPADRPHVLAVVGESGSGKTTLTRLLLGFLRPTRGRVLWRGRDLASLDAQARRDYRRDVQAVFQDPFGAYNPAYRVDRMMLLPARRFGLAASGEEARALAEAALSAVGLRPAETLGRYPHQLSGGQRQRLMVARAIMLRPKVIVADEPVSMVDASLRATILESLWRLRHEAGMSLVYVTHDLTTAYQVADTVMVMRNGEVVEEGDVEQVIRAPRHPYTQELVAAVPPPDPTIDWGLEDRVA
ncbi:MAG: ABC transporter ATP-binding protein [Alphaproteobacteria bacterium]|nr:ABC transporter ATP-binding protein [Alphaproteobacteria bacterium]